MRMVRHEVTLGDATFCVEAELLPEGARVRDHAGAREIFPYGERGPGLVIVPVEWTINGRMVSCERWDRQFDEAWRWTGLIGSGIPDMELLLEYDSVSAAPAQNL